MLPIYVQFVVRTPDYFASTSYSHIKKPQRRLDWANKTVSEVNQRESEHSKKWYD